MPMITTPRCESGFTGVAIIKEVVIVIPFRQDVGGAFRHSVALVGAVLKSVETKHVTLFTCSSNLPAFQELRNRYKNFDIRTYGLRNKYVRWISSKLSYFPGINRRLHDLISEMNPDILFYVAPWTDAIHAKAKRKICIIHDLFDFVNNDLVNYMVLQKERGRRTIECINFSDEIVVESDVTKDHLLKLLTKLKLKKKPISTVGMPPGFINLFPDDESVAYRDFRDYWLAPSHITPLKNQILVVNALILLKEQKIYPKILFTFPSFSTLYLMQLLYTAARGGVLKNIRWRYQASDAEMANYYRHCIGVIMPSKIGPTNMPIEEAKEFNKICLASREASAAYQADYHLFKFGPNDSQHLSELMSASYDRKLSLEPPSRSFFSAINMLISH